MHDVQRQSLDNALHWIGAQHAFYHLDPLNIEQCAPTVSSLLEQLVQLKEIEILQTDCSWRTESSVRLTDEGLNRIMLHMLSPEPHPTESLQDGKLVRNGFFAYVTVVGHGGAQITHLVDRLKEYYIETNAFGWHGLHAGEHIQDPHLIKAVETVRYNSQLPYCQENHCSVDIEWIPLEFKDCVEVHEYDGSEWITVHPENMIHRALGKLTKMEIQNMPDGDLRKMVEHWKSIWENREDARPRQTPVSFEEIERMLSQ
jgi:hypothetical protein